MNKNELDFPFHVALSSEDLPEDLTFSYHIVMKEHDNEERQSVKVFQGMCNDIPCTMCQFTCKDGINRTQVLTAYAEENYPELKI